MSSYPANNDVSNTGTLFFFDGKDVTKNAKFSEIFCIAVSLFLAFKLCWGFSLIVFFLSIPPSESFEKIPRKQLDKEIQAKKGENNDLKFLTG